MKKVLVFLLLTILLVSGCKISRYEGSSVPQDEKSVETQTVEVKAFSFREHKFWDTLEKVVEREGTPDRDIKHEEDAYTIIYDDVYIFEHNAELSFTFLDEKLYNIRVKIYRFDKTTTIEERYNELKKKLIEIYGEPDDEIIDDYLLAAWINLDLDYCMSLYSDEERLSLSMRGEPKYNDMVEN